MYIYRKRPKKKLMYFGEKITRFHFFFEIFITAEDADTSVSSAFFIKYFILSSHLCKIKEEYVKKKKKNATAIVTQCLESLRF